MRPNEDLLTIIKRCKLQWYGHVSHSSGLAKTILQGTMKEGRRQGRQRERWEDNIREWTGLEFAKYLRAVENREKWRKLVVKSPVVPQWPSWLRDRWDEREQLFVGVPLENLPNTTDVTIERRNTSLIILPFACLNALACLTANQHCVPYPAATGTANRIRENIYKCDRYPQIISDWK